MPKRHDRGARAPDCPQMAPADVLTSSLGTSAPVAPSLAV